MSVLQVRTGTVDGGEVALDHGRRTRASAMGASDDREMFHTRIPMVNLLSGQVLTMQKFHSSGHSDGLCAGLNSTSRQTSGLLPTAKLLSNLVAEM